MSKEYLLPDEKVFSDLYVGEVQDVINGLIIDIVICGNALCLRGWIG